MDIVKERLEQWYQERSKEEKKEFIKELLIDAIKVGDSPKAIQRLIKKGNFSSAEVEEIYREIESK